MYVKYYQMNTVQLACTPVQQVNIDCFHLREWSTHVESTCCNRTTTSNHQSLNPVHFHNQSGTPMCKVLYFNVWKTETFSTIFESLRMTEKSSQEGSESYQLHFEKIFLRRIRNKNNTIIISFKILSHLRTHADALGSVEVYWSRSTGGVFSSGG